MFYKRDLISLISVDCVLFFGPDQHDIYEVITELEDSGLSLTVEKGVCAFLGVEFKADN